METQLFCYDNGRNSLRFQLNMMIQPKLDTGPLRGWRCTLYSSTSTNGVFILYHILNKHYPIPEIPLRHKMGISLWTDEL